VREYNATRGGSDVGPAVIGGNANSRMEDSERVDEYVPQVPIDMQSSVIMSHGCVGLGQQSWLASELDISVDCAGVETAAPATGSKATESAIRRADRVRANAMVLQ